MLDTLRLREKGRLMQRRTLMMIAVLVVVVLAVALHTLDLGSVLQSINPHAIR
jgi:hypothetical protein